MPGGFVERVGWAAKIGFLRNILVLTVAVVLFMPFGVRFVVYPQFVQFILADIEEAALGDTRILANRLAVGPAGVTKESLPAEIYNDPAVLFGEYRIYKLKVFSRSGLTVYSSDPKEVGRRNERDYFVNIVSQGRTYSLLVEKAGETAEGETATRDVAETYVPVMAGGEFQGAFEVYYDITDRIGRLDRLLTVATVTTALVGLCLLAATLWMIARAAETVHQRERAEAALKESEALFHGAFDNTDVGMSLISSDRRIRLFNPGLSKMLGYTQEEFRDARISGIT